jgi:hypothetical protein
MNKPGLSVHVMDDWTSHIWLGNRAVITDCLSH